MFKGIDHEYIKKIQIFADQKAGIVKDNQITPDEKEAIKVFEDKVFEDFSLGKLNDLDTFIHAMGLYITKNSKKETPKDEKTEVSTPVKKEVVAKSSETKVETKPITKPEVKPEAKTEAKPEAKLEVKPEVKPATKPEVKQDVVKPETKKVVKPEVEQKARLEISNPFKEDTVKLNNAIYEHKTRLHDIAQDLLGLYEITLSEYNILKKENSKEIENTQFRVIGNNGTINDQWCAHTVSYISKQAGMDIGPHKNTVQGFINWAGNDYKAIRTKIMTANNYKEERDVRAEQIKKQLPEMHEGDFIVWKANSSNNGTILLNLDNGTLKPYTVSHIGIIESIDIENGTITVIEGNANVAKSEDGITRTIVSNSKEGKCGDQLIGEFQEVNPRDGLIRKQYSIMDLAMFGYTGYIDNSKRVS